MFGEKATERGLPVIQTAKYKESREAAMRLIKEKDYIDEGDFWILMNTTKDKKNMLYSGLIISHNGCLKINDNASTKFNPAAVSVEKDGYNDSLVYTYCDKEQGIYEIGEVSRDNCTNDYPYAMAFKRCFDRVVLKLCKLAYYGIYSDSEADEFRQPEEAKKVKKTEEPDDDLGFSEQFAAVNGDVCSECGRPITDIIRPDGTIIPAAEAVQRSEARFNKKLCVKCAKEKSREW